MKVAATLSADTAKKFGVQPQKIEVEVGIPETLDELVKAFGPEVVASATVDALKISVQAGMRRMMQPKIDKDGKVTAPASTPAAIQEWAKNWKPDVRTVVRQSALEKASSAIKTMSAEERKKLLAELQAIK